MFRPGHNPKFNGHEYHLVSDDSGPKACIHVRKGSSMHDDFDLLVHSAANGGKRPWLSMSSRHPDEHGSKVAIESGFVAVIVTIADNNVARTLDRLASHLRRPTRSGFVVTHTRV